MNAVLYNLNCTQADLPKKSDFDWVVNGYDNIEVRTKDTGIIRTEFDSFLYRDCSFVFCDLCHPANQEHGPD